MEIKEKVNLVSHKKIRVVIMLDAVIAEAIEEQVKALQISSNRQNIRSEVYETIIRKFYTQTSPEKASIEKEEKVKPVSKKKQKKKPLNKKAKK